MTSMERERERERHVIKKIQFFILVIYKIKWRTKLKLFPDTLRSPFRTAIEINFKITNY